MHYRGHGDTDCNGTESGPKGAFVFKCNIATQALAGIHKLPDYRVLSAPELSQRPAMIPAKMPMKQRGHRLF